MNVFKPSNATAKSKLPVWLYIQGGGYATNSNANYNGTEVIQASGQGIVFVNFNYRVGLFGFLASEEVRQNGDLNAGLLDQRKLLLWVKKYISQVRGRLLKQTMSSRLTLRVSSEAIRITSSFMELRLVAGPSHTT